MIPLAIAGFAVIMFGVLIVGAYGEDLRWNWRPSSTDEGAPPPARAGSHS